MPSTPESDPNQPGDRPARPALRPLTPVEGRVLGVLVEKQHTVPDTYPLSLNALASGCNQKTARAPVMNVSEAEILEAIDGLKGLSLVFEGSSSRVPRFEHNMQRALGVPSQSVALLAMLLLRGPQTAAELRLNTARLHGFADISSVEAFLDELASQTPPRVVRLPRAPGARENRWMHLLSGEASAAVAAAAAEDTGRAAEGGSTPSAELEQLRAEQQALTDKVARLQGLVEHMAAQLGISADEFLG
ncbi:YceH family protein [Cupriavidus taiwanensis]|uniref:YceH family protein n=1 Tax=Cupriavidus taiwanensis TaxID=164546 RepID=UPI002541A948|nr:YceH family protein [Cupriavidus taiwanensis]MDK3022154.1 YceH family protein [Cupriavidus taiwanensis]